MELRLRAVENDASAIGSRDNAITSYFAYIMSPVTFDLGSRDPEI